MKLITTCFLFLITCISLSVTWTGLLYEHGHFQGRRATLHGDCSSCVHLLNKKLCDDTTCIPAWNSTSSIYLKVNTVCIKVYKTYTCNGEYWVLTEKDVCLMNFCDAKTPCPQSCNLNDQVRSVSSCEYYSRCKSPHEWIESRKREIYRKRPKRQIDPTLNIVQSELLNHDLAWYTERVQNGVTIVDSVITVITSYWPNPRQDFTSQASKDRMVALNAHRLDHKGHVVASKLSGPTNDSYLWNLIPQTMQLNLGTGRQPDWKSTEMDIIEFLRNNTCHFVDWDLEMKYFPHSNRPHTFLLQVLFMVGEETVYTRVRTRSISCNNVPGNTTCIDLLAPRK